MAAYAFKIACERIASMAAAYKPTPSSSRASSSFTRRARLSYALGVIEGLTKDVEANKEREEHRRKGKLEKARQAVRTGEAYEESDDDDNDDNWISTKSMNSNSSSAGIKDISQKGSKSETESTVPCSNIISNDTDKKEHISKNDTGTKEHSGNNETDKKEQTKTILDVLEKEENTTLALIDHHERIAKDILKEAKVKVHKTPKRAKIEFNYESYEQGIKDAKEIDLDQRAIRGDSHVVKEEIKSRSKI